jgi:hypothetical protein
MKWFRFYDDALHDPKVQRLAPPLFKEWVNILCLANRGEPRGLLPSAQDIGYALRRSEAATERTLHQLVEAGLLDRDEAGDLWPHNWSGRQFRADDVNARVQQHRNGQRNVTRNVSVTANATAPEQSRSETEQSRAEQTPKRPASQAAGAERADVDLAYLKAAPIDILAEASEVLPENVLWGGMDKLEAIKRAYSPEEIRHAIERTRAGRGRSIRYLETILKGERDGAGGTTAHVAEGRPTGIAAGILEGEAAAAAIEAASKNRAARTAKAPDSGGGDGALGS